MSDPRPAFGTVPPVRDLAARPVGALLLLALALSPLTDARAQDPVEDRAREVSALFRADPSGFDELFAPSFLEQVPEERLTGIFAAYHSRLGESRSVNVVSRDGSYAADLEFLFAEASVPATLAVDPSPPHRVVGLFLRNPVPLAADLSAVEDEVRGLPGTATLLVARLGPDGVEPLAEVAPDTALAIGSAFKLYVLGEAVRSVESGERSWTDVTALESAGRSLPSGILQDWPTGSPVTLHTLALLMISRSDNTATDHLIGLLGRERVEAAQAALGHSRPELNRPFLTTREAFVLKADTTGALVERFAGLDRDGRRAFLEDAIGEEPPRAADLSMVRPMAIDRVEWFASAADLARALAWMRRGDVDRPDWIPLSILAVNPGLGAEGRSWAYVGYKGGSEPGVLAVAWLLRDEDGRWYAVTGAWNRLDATVDEARYLGLLQRAIALIAARSR